MHTARGESSHAPTLGLPFSAAPLLSAKALPSADTSLCGLLPCREQGKRLPKLIPLNAFVLPHGRVTEWNLLR